MSLLDTLNNLNSLWLLIIIALGLCFITISVVLILLERIKRQTVEDFSQQDKTMIIGLVEERIDELTAKMDIFREDIETSTQTLFNKITSKVDDLKATPGQNQQFKLDSLVPVISNLNEHVEAVSKKVDILKEKIDKVESAINYQMQQGQSHG
ncbi:MAG: hypothetical protein A2539_03855 [Elusimicrobia bacterium RIFOXYD2_FULL_34_15]|nr:MAG: hypothetical protein A2539_03855 [Elusimicrobia bacterium RIFOXYD2_FULL_34_15]